MWAGQISEDGVLAEYLPFGHPLFCNNSCWHLSEKTPENKSVHSESVKYL